MIKKAILVAVLFAGSIVSRAQLANTKWSGIMKVPTEEKVTLTFTTDSLILGITDYNMIGEVMSYSVKDSVVTLNKLSGNSPCDTAVFTLKYAIRGNQLFIGSLADPCDARVQSWPKDPFDKR